MTVADFPDTASGYQYWSDHQVTFREMMQRKPPTKRFPYPSLDWTVALQTGDSFVVVRGESYLGSFHDHNISTVHELPFPTLVCVLVKPAYYGAVKSGAKIYIPTDDEIEQGYVDCFYLLRNFQYIGPCLVQGGKHVRFHRMTVVQSSVTSPQA